MEQNEALLTGCAASVSAREHGLRVRKELTRSRRDLRRTLHSATKIITKRTKARVGNSMQVVGALKFMQSEAKQTATRKLTSRLNRAKEAMRVQFAVSPRSVTPMSKGTGHSASSQSLRRPRSTRSVKSSAPAADARTTSALSRTQSQHQLRQRISMHKASQAAIMHRPETPDATPHKGAMSLKAMLAAGAMMQSEAPVARSRLVSKRTGGEKRGGRAGRRSTGKSSSKDEERRGTTAGPRRTLSHAASFLRQHEHRRQQVNKLKRHPSAMLAVTGSHHTRSLTTLGRVSDELDVVRIDDLFPSNNPANKYTNYSARPATAPSRGHSSRNVLSAAADSTPALSPRAAASVLTSSEVPLAAAIRATHAHQSSVAAFADRPHQGRVRPQPAADDEASSPALHRTASGRRPASASAGMRRVGSTRSFRSAPVPRRLNHLPTSPSSPAASVGTAGLSPMSAFATPKPSSFRFFQGDSQTTALADADIGARPVSVT